MRTPLCRQMVCLGVLNPKEALPQTSIFSVLGCEGIFVPVLSKNRFHNLIPSSQAASAKTEDLIQANSVPCVTVELAKVVRGYCMMGCAQSRNAE